MKKKMVEMDSFVVKFTLQIRNCLARDPATQAAAKQLLHLLVPQPVHRAYPCRFMHVAFYACSTDPNVMDVLAAARDVQESWPALLIAGLPYEDQPDKKAIMSSIRNLLVAPLFFYTPLVDPKVFDEVDQEASAGMVWDYDRMLEHLKSVPAGVNSHGMVPISASNPSELSKEIVQHALRHSRRTNLPSGSAVVVHFIGHGNPDGDWMVGEDTFTFHDLLETVCHHTEVNLLVIADCCFSNAWVDLLEKQKNELQGLRLCLQGAADCFAYPGQLTRHLTNSLETNDGYFQYPRYSKSGSYVGDQPNPFKVFNAPVRYPADFVTEGHSYARGANVLRGPGNYKRLEAAYDKDIRPLFITVKETNKPLGLQNGTDFEEFCEAFFGLEKSPSMIVFHGSSVQGYSFHEKEGRESRAWCKDTSDFDVALVSPELYKLGKEDGIRCKSGHLESVSFKPTERIVVTERNGTSVRSLAPLIPAFTKVSPRTNICVYETKEPAIQHSGCRLVVWKGGARQLIWCDSTRKLFRFCRGFCLAGPVS